LEHVYTVARLEGKLRMLEQGISCPAPDDRHRLTEYLNSLDGEIAFCKHMADRRQLAARVNCAAGLPLIDGLSMRGLTFALGEEPDLWAGFQGLIQPSA
jgi:hypothetical protein